MTALNFAPLDTELTIKQIRAGESIGKRLNSLGFTVGSKLTLVNVLGGDCIVRFKDSRIALDRMLSSKIIVEE